MKGFGKRILLFVIVLGFSVTLVGVDLCSRDVRGEAESQRNFLGYYDYDASLPLSASEEIIVDEPGYTVLKVYFDSVNRERVPGLLSLPKKEGNVPCVVFLHGYGGSKDDIQAGAGQIASEGYAVTGIDAEYHGERREEGKELYSPQHYGLRERGNPNGYRPSQAVDYLETRPEINSEKIGYAGGSMGGILGAIFIGVEPRIDAAALIVAGGNMSLMVRKSQHFTMPAIREFLQRENVSYEELQELLDPIDPINFISNFSPRPVVFHLGRYDTVVPAEAGRQLYGKAGEPKHVYWYDAGHDAPFELVLARILDFMDRNLLGKSLVRRELLYWTIRYAPLAAIIVAAAAMSAYFGKRALSRRKRARALQGKNDAIYSIF